MWGTAGDKRVACIEMEEAGMTCDNCNPPRTEYPYLERPGEILRELLEDPE